MTAHDRLLEADTGYRQFVAEYEDSAMEDEELYYLVDFAEWLV
jgi:hypothetical protein